MKLVYKCGCNKEIKDDTDNVLYLQDENKGIVVEIRMKEGVLQSSDDDPIYLQFAMALPELTKLK